MEKEYFDKKLKWKNRKHKAPISFSIANESKYLVIKNIPPRTKANQILPIFGVHGIFEDYKKITENDKSVFKLIY